MLSALCLTLGAHATVEIIEPSWVETAPEMVAIGSLADGSTKKFRYFFCACSFLSCYKAKEPRWLRMRNGFAPGKTEYL